MTYYVYIVGRTAGPVKIGITRKLERRVHTLQTAAPFRVKLLRGYELEENPTIFEKEIHSALAHRHTHGEWFDVSASDAADIVSRCAAVKEIQIAPSKTNIRPRRERPVGSLKAKGGRPKKSGAKVLVTLRLDPEVIDKFKTTGPGWQVRMGDTLKLHMP